MTDPDPSRVTGIFGGTFDPVHKGHLDLAHQLCDGGHLEQVLFLPAYVPPHKRDREITPAHHRLAMLHLAIDEIPHFFLSEHEISAGTTVYTIDTAAHFAQCLGDRLRLIIGMDSLRDLHKWYRASDLIQNYRLLIYRRPGYPIPSVRELQERFGESAAATLAEAMVDGPEYDVSSTEIREKVRQGGSVDALLPDGVAQYIHSHGLYR